MSGLVPLPKVQADYGISRTKIYRLLAAKDLAAKKIANRTYITKESLDAWLASLPDFVSELDDLPRAGA